MVNVGEGPGHVRDTEMALVESGVGEQLDDSQLPFADLNYEEVGWIKECRPGQHAQRIFLSQLRGRSRSDRFHAQAQDAPLGRIHRRAKEPLRHDPGIKYGWPKNVLHHAGIPQTVFDINASLPKAIAIVDGIVCMEGDGPIMGSPKPMGLVVIGTHPTAVDATIARIMQLNPEAVSYLQLAGGLTGLNPLGPLAEQAIRQCGERWQDVSQSFEILDVPHLREPACQAGLVHFVPRVGSRGAIRLRRRPAQFRRLGLRVAGPMQHEPTPQTNDRWLLGWTLLAAIGLWAAMAVPFVRGQVYVADDLGAFHLPLRAFYTEQLGAGRPFDWMPSLFCGFYLTGEGQVGGYHPLHLLLYRWLPLPTAFDLELLLSYPLMLWGTYGLLLRRIGQRTLRCSAVWCSRFPASTCCTSCIPMRWPWWPTFPGCCG